MLHSRFSARAASLLVVLPVVLSGQRSQVPLKNWATPLRWQPSQTERAALAKARPDLQFSPNAVSVDALSFVAITPCRLVDTRGAAAGFNGSGSFAGPSIASGGTLTVPVQSSVGAATMPAACGTIPSIAQAYSFNLTVVPHGAVDYVSLWPAGGTQPFVATLDDPQGAIISNAAIVPAGTPSGGISVYNAGPATTDVIIDMNGYFTAPTDNDTNTAVGAGTLAHNFNGTFNTVVGAQAMNMNVGGNLNAAVGYEAMYENTSGGQNTALGMYTLQNNVTSPNNTAIGYQALQNTTGGNNIAIGSGAGVNIAGTGSNIDIGSGGAAGDSNTIRIGTPGLHGPFFAAGIRAFTTGSATGVPVLIDVNGQMGTNNSSRRFKEDIRDMGDASSGLMRLRPVTFRYKDAYDDGSKPIDYGLIAEEVAQVYPDLAVKGADGLIETVQYQKLTPMLLNELQKQHQEMEQQRETIQLQKDRIARQEEQNQKLEMRLAAVEARLSAGAPARAEPAH